MSTAHTCSTSVPTRLASLDKWAELLAPKEATLAFFVRPPCPANSAAVGAVSLQRHALRWISGTSHEMVPVPVSVLIRLVVCTLHHPSRKMTRPKTPRIAAT